jgi:hypothetical protein
MRFSLKSFKRLAERLKFEVVFHEYSVGGIPMLLNISSHFKKNNAPTKTGMQVTRWLKKLLSIHDMKGLILAGGSGHDFTLYRKQFQTTDADL